MSKKYDKSFDEYLSLLSEKYYSDKNKVNEEAYNSLIEMGVINAPNFKRLKIITIVILMIIGLLGIYPNTVFLPAYYFGSIFFIAAYAATIGSDNGAPPFILLTHGTVGIGCMTVPAIVNYFTNLNGEVVYTIVFIYFGIAILCALGGLLFLFIGQSIDHLKFKMSYKLIPSILLIISVFLTQVFPHIENILTKIKI